MAQKPETRFRNRFMLKVEKIPYSHWFSIQQVAICGTPDVIGLIRGNFIALEFKSETGTQSKLQKYHADKIERAWGKYYLVYPSNADDILVTLNNITI